MNNTMETTSSLPVTAATTAEPSVLERDVPVQVIVIVGCVCGAIIVTLFIVLVVLLCRRHEMKRKYQQTRGAAIIFSAANGAKANSDGSQQGQAGAYDALENDRARRGHVTVADGGDVFATNIPASYPPNNNEYAGWSSGTMGRREALRGSGPDLLPTDHLRSPASSSGDSTDRGYGESLPDHADRYNRRLATGSQQERFVQSPAGYRPNSSVDHNSSMNSLGHSRPKRIIHEVVV